MELTTLLGDAGVPVDDAVLLRHADRSRPRPPYALWKHDRVAFERYQSMQKNPRWLKLLAAARYWIAFAANEVAETVFLGVYEARDPHLFETPMPNEVDEGMTTVPHYVFQTRLLPHLAWLTGTMKIRWSGGELRWVQSASEGPKIVTALGADDGPGAPFGVSGMLAAVAPLSVWRASERRARALPSQPVDVIAWMQRLELRSASHEQLLERVAARAVGRAVESSALLDLVVDRRVMIEIKSVMGDAVMQARAALAQLYHYRFVYREMLPEALLLAVFGSRPVDGTTDLAAFLESFGIGAAWAEGSGFGGTPRARAVAPWLFL
jgi:hypothetical protein